MPFYSRDGVATQSNKCVVQCYKRRYSVSLSRVRNLSLTGFVAGCLTLLRENHVCRYAIPSAGMKRTSKPTLSMPFKRSTVFWDHHLVRSTSVVLGKFGSFLVEDDCGRPPTIVIRLSRISILYTTSSRSYYSIHSLHYYQHHHLPPRTLIHTSLTQYQYFDMLSTSYI